MIGYVLGMWLKIASFVPGSKVLSTVFTISSLVIGKFILVLVKTAPEINQAKHGRT